MKINPLRLLLYFTSAVLVVAALYLVLSYRFVVFEFDKNLATSAQLYSGTSSKDPKTIAPATENPKQDIVPGKRYILKKGNYYVSFGGDKIDRYSEGFVVASNDKRVFSFSYSSSYLETILESSRESIRDAIEKEFGDEIDLYDIESERLMENGDWYVAALVYNGDASSPQRDTLKLIMNKVNDKWTVSQTPGITQHSIGNDTPRDVANAANIIDIGSPLMPGYSLGESNYVPETYE